ncbi:MAG: hypothetical protein ACOZCL_07445 [Bacillota bacterium]
MKLNKKENETTEMNNSIINISEIVQLLNKTIFKPNTEEKKEVELSAVNIFNIYSVLTIKPICYIIALYSVISFVPFIYSDKDTYYVFQSILYIFTELLSKSIAFIITLIALEVTIYSNSENGMVKEYKDNKERFEVDIIVNSIILSLLIVLAYGNSVSAIARIKMLPTAFYTIVGMLTFTLIIKLITMFFANGKLIHFIYLVFFPLSSYKKYKANSKNIN